MPTPRKYANDAERQRAYRERQAAARAQELQQKGLPPVPTIPTMPGTARWQALIRSAQASLEAARDEMQAYFDDRSEAWQEGDRGQELLERIEVLDGVLQDLEAV